jgi:hypothetical protein
LLRVQAFFMDFCILFIKEIIQLHKTSNTHPPVCINLCMSGYLRITAICYIWWTASTHVRHSHKGEE